MKMKQLESAIFPIFVIFVLMNPPIIILLTFVSIKISMFSWLNILESNTDESFFQSSLNESNIISLYFNFVHCSSCFISFGN